MDPIEYDLEIDCPDFLDHDEDLLYLYGVDLPYEHLKFNTSFDWLIPVVHQIANIIASGDFKHMENHEHYANRFKSTNVLIINIKTLYRDVVDFIQWYNINKNYG